MELLQTLIDRILRVIHPEEREKKTNITFHTEIWWQFPALVLTAAKLANVRANHVPSLILLNPLPIWLALTNRGKKKSVHLVIRAYQ